MKHTTWISQRLNEQLPFDLAVDAGAVLDKWLPPSHGSADYWWPSEYYWGALTWSFFLSYESKFTTSLRESDALGLLMMSQLVYARCRGARQSC